MELEDRPTLSPRPADRADRPIEEADERDAERDASNDWTERVADKLAPLRGIQLGRDDFLPRQNLRGQF